MTKLSVTIYVVPVGKGRPRTTFNKKTGKVIAYTPQKTAHAENLIRDRVMGAAAQLGAYFERGTPIDLTAVFYRERPKGAKKSMILPTSRPDWDNNGKLLTDALEHFVYANDSQITTALIKKRFGTPPRIELTMEVDNGTSGGVTAPFDAPIYAMKQGENGIIVEGSRKVAASGIEVIDVKWDSGLTSKGLPSSIFETEAAPVSEVQLQMRAPKDSMSPFPSRLLD